MAEKSQQSAARPGVVFGRRVREERERQWLSLRDLAARVSSYGGTLDRSTLARIEAGETRGNLDTLFDLAAALGVSPLWLMTPRDDDESILIGKAKQARTISAVEAREWIRGDRWLRDSDLVAHFAAFPPTEQDARIYDYVLAGVDPIVLAASGRTADELRERTRRTAAALRDAVDDHLSDKQTAAKKARRSNAKGETNG